MGVMKIRDENGNFIPINALRGEDGKSAYEQAREGGYQGEESEFIYALSRINDIFAIPLTASDTNDEHCDNKSNPHQVTAEQTGAISKHYPTSADLNTDLTKGDNTVTICCYYGDTLNTPYKEGKTACTHGMVMTNAHSEQYGTQFCLPSGDDVIFLRQLSGGVVSEWCELNSSNHLLSQVVSNNGGTIYNYLEVSKEEAPLIDLVAGNRFSRIMKNAGGDVDDGIYLMDFDNRNSPENRLVFRVCHKTAKTSLSDAIGVALIENNAGDYYRFFGEHNKPKKAYTGNGGSQTVQIGGLGVVAWLTSSDGLQGHVSKNGFFGMNSNGQAASQIASFITFENGVLTLNNGGLCNASGIQYTVQVL